MMTKRMAIATLALLGVFVALYLALYKTGILGEIVCTVGSCETVQASRYATFLGLPVAMWGVGFYLAALALALLGVQDRFADEPRISLALVGLSGWGVLFSLWLTYLELWVIRAICMWCVVSAVIVLMIFLVSVLDWRDVRVERAEPAASD